MDQGTSSDAGEAADGTVRAHPASSSSQPSAEEGDRRGIHAGSVRRRPFLDHVTSSSSSSPYNLSRKNSHEDVAAPASSARKSGRNRKLSDPDDSQARSSGVFRADSPHSASRPTSTSPRRPESMSAQNEAALSDNNDEPIGSSSGSANEQMHSAGTGMGQTLHPHHAYQHQHRFANDNAEHIPHHVLGASHQARLRQSGHGAESLPPRKLGTWDGVFMPVSLNVSGQGAG